MKRLAVASVLACATTACAAPAPIAPRTPIPPEVATVCAVGGCELVAPKVRASVEACAARHDCAAPPETVCDAKNASACTTRALDLWAVRPDDGMPAVLALFERACSLGDPYGCSYAGRIVLDGVGVTADEKRGTELLESACDDEIVLACDALLRHEREAAPVATERLAASERYVSEAACWRGDASQCFDVGLYFDYARQGFPRDMRRSVQAYARACSLGEDSGCNNLANDYYYGEGVAVDWARAAKLYGEACNMGGAIGCANIGFLSEYGDAVPLDLKRAAALYRGACTQGNAYACMHEAMMAEYRGGVPHAPDKASAHWQHICETSKPKDGARACAFYGVMLEDGKVGGPDRNAAAEHMKRACTAGYAPACKWAGL